MRSRALLIQISSSLLFSHFGVISAQPSKCASARLNIRIPEAICLPSHTQNKTKKRRRCFSRPTRAAGIGGKKEVCWFFGLVVRALMMMMMFSRNFQYIGIGICKGSTHSRNLDSQCIYMHENIHKRGERDAAWINYVEFLFSVSARAQYYSSIDQFSAPSSISQPRETERCVLLGISYWRLVFVITVMMMGLVEAHIADRTIIVAARRCRCQFHEISLVVMANDSGRRTDCRHIVLGRPIECESWAMRNVSRCRYTHRRGWRGYEIRTQLLMHDVGHFLYVIVRPCRWWIPLIEIGRRRRLDAAVVGYGRRWCWRDERVSCWSKVFRYPRSRRVNCWTIHIQHLSITMFRLHHCMLIAVIIIKCCCCCCCSVRWCCARSNNINIVYHLRMTFRDMQWFYPLERILFVADSNALVINFAQLLIVIWVLVTFVVIAATCRRLFTTRCCCCGSVRCRCRRCCRLTVFVTLFVSILMQLLLVVLVMMRGGDFVINCRGPCCWTATVVDWR